MTSKWREPAEDRWGATESMRTEPVRLTMRTEWAYSEREKRDGSDCICCPGRHAFGRGGRVVASDVPSQYENQQDLASHMWRAIAAFGDDKDLVIEVRLAPPPPGRPVERTRGHEEDERE